MSDNSVSFGAAMGHGDLVWAIPAAIVLAGTTAFGAWLLERLRAGEELNRALRLAMAGALGLGALAIVTFGLSCAGFIPRWLMAILPLIGLVAGSGALARLMRAPAAVERREALLPFLAGSVGLLVVAAVAGSTIPPLDFDELHYHLIQPKETFLAGRYVDLDWNVYTKFPQNVESLYLYGMIVTKSTLKGVVFGRMLVSGFLAFLAMGLYGLVAPLTTRTAGAISAALAVVMPGTVSLVLLSYVEPAQACYSFLALAAALRPRHALTAGIFAGLAAGTKYTAIVLCAAPLALAFVREPKALALYAAGALIAFAPWGARGIVEHRNPVFPLGGFGTNWSGAQAEKFAEAHRGKSDAKQTFDDLYAGATKEVWLNPVLAILPILGILAWPSMSPEARKVFTLAAAMSLIYVLVWVFATHRISRFLVPVQPWLAVAGLVPLGAMSAPIRRAAAACGVLAVALEVVLVIVIGYVRIDQRARFTDAQFRSEIAGDLEPQFEANKIAGKVLLVGEMRTFYLTVPFEAQSVFNIRGWDLEPASLRARGITHVLVHWGEVERVDRDYRYLYEGQQRWGMEQTILPEQFAAFRVVHRQGPVAIYEVPGL